MSALGFLKDLYPGAVLRTFPRAYVSFTVAATTGTLYQRSTGNKTPILVTLAVARRAGGNTFLQVGEGDFTAPLPALPVIRGQSVGYSIEDGTLPIFLFEADISAQAVAAAAPTSDIRAMATVLEF